MKNNFLDGKVLYLVPTGAHKTKYFDLFLEQLSSYNPNIWILPTEMGRDLLPNYEALSLKYHIKCDFSKSNNLIVPEEDLVVVAPCTFNTMNKIARGIADNYPLSVIHNALGKGVKCIIAPAMDVSLWNNFALQESLRILQSQKNVQVIFPEYIYDDDGNLVKTTMAPYEKIVDSILHCYTKIKYENVCDGPIPESILEAYFDEFANAGKKLAGDGYLSNVAGFLAKRIPEGYLVTATGAQVGALNKEDIVLVVSVVNRVVHWCGTKCPTSEFPLVYELFNEFKNVDVIVHGHCKDITYSKFNKKYLTACYLKYGEWGESVHINPILYEYGKAIMKLHGEIVFANSFLEAYNSYKEMRYEKH